MSKQLPFSLKIRNPDVLSCIANLSNDEVFTPPDVANQMLDLLADAWAVEHDGANIWADKTVTFLDPCTKSGVFLREITKRLTEGLSNEFPDLQKRVDHILNHQVFGIGITRLTSLLARRSVYCSMHANGEHSIAKNFPSDSGNIWFERMEHEWINDNCHYCNISKRVLGRGSHYESHAYGFIHTDDICAHINEIFGSNMQFDVIIGNPPYQLGDGGFGASAIPVYNKFVERAKELEPRYLTMIIPSRWLFGGRGLDAFREAMLRDNRIRALVDYPDSRQVFPNVDVAGGVCYFLWDKDNPGRCNIIESEHGGGSTQSIRPLLEKGAEVFIRSNKAIPILQKIMRVETSSHSLSLPDKKKFNTQVSAQKPFGLRTFFRGANRRTQKNDVLVIQNGGRGWTSRSEVKANRELIDKWKVFTSKSSSEHAGQVDRNGQRRVLSLSGIIPPGSVVTETYVLLGSFDTEEEARNCFSYVTTKLFRFLIAIRSSAQDLSRAAYQFIPTQDFSEPWSDRKLYAKYGLSRPEILHIENFIKPMDISTEPLNG